MGRHDIQGIFWADSERVSKRGVKQNVNRPLPPFPDTGWRPPASFPNLASAKILSIDIESYDPGLLSKGPGVRTNGYIVGIAVGADNDGRWYFPMRHTVQPEVNLDPDAVLRWARDQLCNAQQPKVGANLLYDLDYLHAAGVPIVGQMLDVQVAEPLLDENARSYALGTLAKKYLGETKVEDELYRWSAVAYGGKEGRAQAANIYRCPPSLVGPYAEGDVDLPLRIFAKQKLLLEQEGLLELFDVESRLIPLLLAMRQRGVAVNVPAAQQAYEMFTLRINAAEKSFGGINVYAAGDIAKYCRKHGIEFSTTALGNASFTASYLERHNDPLIRSIAEVRKWYKVRDTFLKGYILESHVNGRLHCQFNQLRSDEGGTVSGRLSSSLPNLQNIPVRDAEIGPLMRSLFVPDEGETWGRLDWSQIEFRFLCHYGRGEGAEQARALYCNDPATDFHKMVAELVWPGQPEMRKSAKNISFGLVYGMGEPHMAETLGRPLADVKPLFETYHRMLPFIKRTYNDVSTAAAARGYITTILGRRRRFNDWELASWGERSSAYPSEEAALAANPGRKVRRAFTHKALNALLQGSAADLMKKAMVQLWESGLCAPTGLGAPLLTVHDELDFSVPPRRERLLQDVQQIMEHCIPLRVPVRADPESGPHWGACA